MTERVSLEGAKRLRDAGYPQESENIAAPCACEILQKLPKRIPVKIGNYCVVDFVFELRFVRGHWWVGYSYAKHTPRGEYRSESLVCVLVDLWSWLAEKKLLETRGAGW